MDHTVHGILQARILEWVELFPSPGDPPNPGIKSRSPKLQVDSLPAEPQGKPKNTGVCSLSLLQGIFPTQELNWGLLHSKWILYQLSYEESPPRRREKLCTGTVLWCVADRWRKDPTFLQRCNSCLVVILIDEWFS